MEAIIRDVARLGALLALTMGGYGATSYLTHRPAQWPALLGLTLLAVGVERAWAFLRWLSPLQGMFGDPDQEYSLMRALERELSRSLRHDAPLVIVALRGRRNLSLRAIERALRASDIVIRGRGRHCMILMTETQLDQARQVIERLVRQMPVRAAAIAEAGALARATTGFGFGRRYQAKRDTAHEQALALVKGLQLGLFRALTRARRDAPPPVYEVASADITLANVSATARPLADLTERVA